jgi:hypothetical protein
LINFKAILYGASISVAAHVELVFLVGNVVAPSGAVITDGVTSCNISSRLI